MMKDPIIKCLEPSLMQLQVIWNEMGMSVDQKEERSQVVVLHVQSLLEQMVEEETAMRDKIIANIKEFSQELSKVCKELRIAETKLDENLTLLEQEKNLRTEVDRLLLERHLRLKRLKKLNEDESTVCNRLHHSLNPNQISGIPTEEQLKEFSNYVESLEKELKKREDLFTSTKDVLLRLWDDLEVSDMEAEENTICKSDASNYQLSDTNMNYLKGLISKYENQLTENETKANLLRNSIKQLWSRLEIDQEQRTAFDEVTKGCKPSVIVALELELEALKKMKLENLKKLIDNMRNEIKELWDKCYFSPEERKQFAAASSEDYSEDMLSLHENEVKRVTDHYNEHQSYYQTVAHWYTLWKKWLDFEERANDPKRFGNRGGKLLQEEKLRKALNKEFCKVEKDLNLKLVNYENETGKPFLIDGLRFLDTMKDLKEEHKQKKEQERIDRQTARDRELQKELVYGSKPTPTKRRFAGTPVKTPTSKKAKVTTMSTGSVHSRVQSRINVPRISKTPGRVKTVKGGRATPLNNKKTKTMRVLKEVNKNVLGTKAGYNFENVPLQPTEISFVSSSNSFSDFTRELHEATKNNQRSSVLSSANEENIPVGNY